MDNIIDIGKNKYTLEALLKDLKEREDEIEKVICIVTTHEGEALIASTDKTMLSDLSMAATLLTRETIFRLED